MRKNTYTVKETNEDPKKIVLTRPGKDVVFTMEEVDEHIEKLKKLKDECEGTLTVLNAKEKNIEEHHPFVMNLSEQDLFTAHMYQDLKNQKKPFEDKLMEVDAQLAEYDEDIAEIKEQIPELS